MTERAEFTQTQPAQELPANRDLADAVVATRESRILNPKRRSVFSGNRFAVVLAAMAVVASGCVAADDAKNRDGTPTPAIPAHRINPNFDGVKVGSILSEDCLYLDRLQLAVDQKTLNSEGYLADKAILEVFDKYGADQILLLEPRTDNVVIMVSPENRLPLKVELESFIGGGGIEEVNEYEPVTPVGCEELPLTPAAQ